jgi:hypothetical protein
MAYDIDNNVSPLVPPQGIGWYTSPNNKMFHAGIQTIDGKKVSMREFYLELVDAVKVSIK